MKELRFRQIHLDFHTSEHIAGIGSEFDPDEFADTLAAAHVDSINLFARCHHGWMYYDSARFPERRHPHLTRNLLKEQIDACHARGILAPIYTTIEWDHLTARQHPEWLVIDEQGRQVGTPPFEAGFYRRLCLNTPYVDFIEEHTVELCELLDVDGFWFDICNLVPCNCTRCIGDMLAQGMDPADGAQRRRFADQMLRRFQERMARVVHDRLPEATTFFNSGHVSPWHRGVIHTFTHLELESLPSGGWGYMHFPVTQRYARTLGVQTLGMGGKFHLAWGDFHSFKSEAALEFECLRMLALGAKCSVGDQLHPAGKICAPTYDLIGKVYAKVEAAEPWCRGAEPLADIGVLTPEEFRRAGTDPIASAATRLLQELRHQFDILDSQADFARYRVLVLPDAIPVDETLAARLSAFIAAGGALLASHRAGLNPEGTGFAVPELGVQLIGDAPYSPDFILPGSLTEALPDVPHVMYLRGLEVAPAADAEVLCPVVKPYFNRTWEHFCSHQHTPAEGLAGYPGVVRRGRCVYFAHPVFSLYHQYAPRWAKTLLGAALDLLLPEPLVRAGGPSSALFALNRQAAAERLVLHVLHYVPERRAERLDIIEDVVPIFEVPASVRVEGAVQTVELVPQREAVPFAMRGGRAEFVIPRVEGHQMVVIG
jgi:hypothetical protein